MPTNPVATPLGNLHHLPSPSLRFGGSSNLRIAPPSGTLSYAFLAGRISSFRSTPCAAAFQQSAPLAFTHSVGFVAVEVPSVALFFSPTETTAKSPATPSTLSQPETIRRTFYHKLLPTPDRQKELMAEYKAAREAEATAADTRTAMARTKKAIEKLYWEFSRYIDFAVNSASKDHRLSFDRAYCAAEMRSHANAKFLSIVERNDPSRGELSRLLSTTLRFELRNQATLLATQRGSIAGQIKLKGRALRETTAMQAAIRDDSVQDLAARKHWKPAKVHAMRHQAELLAPAVSLDYTHTEQEFPNPHEIIGSDVATPAANAELNEATAVIEHAIVEKLTLRERVVLTALFRMPINFSASEIILHAVTNLPVNLERIHEASNLRALGELLGLSQSQLQTTRDRAILILRKFLLQKKLSLASFLTEAA